MRSIDEVSQASEARAMAHQAIEENETRIREILERFNRDFDTGWGELFVRAVRSLQRKDDLRTRLATPEERRGFILGHASYAVRTGRRRHLRQ